MKLAKPRIDVGLYTNRRDEMLAFWRDEVGLPYEELLPMGGGVQQHRFGLNGSVLKVNHSRDPIPDEPRAGYRELVDRAAGAGGAARARGPRREPRAARAAGTRVGVGRSRWSWRSAIPPRSATSTARRSSSSPRARTRSAAATRSCASRAIPRPRRSAA